MHTLQDLTYRIIFLGFIMFFFFFLNCCTLDLGANKRVKKHLKLRYFLQKKKKKDMTQPF